jgi:hypothetical protein
MLSSSISYWDLIKFPYFVDMYHWKKEGIGGEREGDFMDNFNKLQVLILR